MNEWIIYHNPRCSKSRQTLELLRHHGIEPKVIEYLKSPPSPETLKDLLKKLNLEAKQIVRTKEPLFADLNLDLNNTTAILNALAQNPTLLERPIVVRDTKAALGRPPENVLQLISQ